MRIKLNMSTAIIIGKYETGKDYEDLIKNSPRKKKKKYKKELAKIIIEQIKKSIEYGKLPRD